MSFKLTTTVQKPARELIPAKTHIARIYQIVELGHLTSDTYKNKDGSPKVSHNISISFEFPSLMRVYDEKKGPQPMVKTVSYSLTFSEKSKLLPIVKALLSVSPKDGDTVDVGALLGKPCMVSVGHSEKDGIMRDNITGVMALVDGVEEPKAVLPQVGLTFGGWDDKIFAALPDFIRKDIESSVEYKTKFGAAVAGASAAVADFNNS